MIQTGVRAVGRAWACWQTYGCAETSCRLLHRMRVISVNHPLDIFIKEAGAATERLAPLPAFDARGIELREVAQGDLKDLILAEGLEDRAFMDEQFARSSRLFVALADKTIVAVNWGNPRFAHLDFIHRPLIRLPQGVAYSHSAMTAPAYRRRGIGGALKDYQFEVFHGEGYQLVILAAFLESYAAIAWHNANGFLRWGRIQYLCFGKREVWWTRLTPMGRRYASLLDNVCPGVSVG